MRDSGIRRDYEIYRDYLKHEDGLIDNRLTWNIAIQGFLLAASGLLLGKLAEPIHHGDTVSQPDKDVLVLVGHYALPCIGLGTALAAFLGILAAHRAIRVLARTWDRHYLALVQPKPLLPPLAGGGARDADLLGYISSLGVPAMFVEGWGVVLWRNAAPGPHALIGNQFWGLFVMFVCANWACYFLMWRNPPSQPSADAQS